jgi:hypothetical protein
MPVDPKSRVTQPSTKRILGTYGHQDLADIMPTPMASHGDWNALKGAFRIETTDDDPNASDVRDDNEGADQ